jgi:hypothetical protein
MCLNPRTTIVHQAAIYPGGCVPTAFSMALDFSQEDAYRFFGTTTNGTSMAGATSRLKELGLPVSITIATLDYQEALAWLIPFSKHYPIILSCQFDHRVYNKGRTRELHHAVLVVDGIAYDPAMGTEIPADQLAQHGDEKITIQSFVIIGFERPEYGAIQDWPGYGEQPLRMKNCP